MGSPYMKKHIEFRDIFLILRGPNYYDFPEGQHPFQKIWSLSKYAILGSTVVGVHDCLFTSMTQNIFQTMNTVGYYMVPSVALCTAFASVTYIATDIRGKDDKWNYTFGVAACVPILHAIKPKSSFTIPASLFLLVSALLKKDSIQNNWQFFPKMETEHDFYIHDWSMVKAEWPKRPY